MTVLKYMFIYTLFQSADIWNESSPKYSKLCISPSIVNVRVLRRTLNRLIGERLIGPTENKTLITFWWQIWLKGNYRLELFVFAQDCWYNRRTFLEWLIPWSIQESNWFLMCFIIKKYHVSIHWLADIDQLCFLLRGFLF